jgi:hypothetical protein
MPITMFLDGYKPAPETKRVMGVAFEAARVALKLSDRDDPAVAILAKRIIAIAKEGERNPDLLCERALNDLRAPPPRVQRAASVGGLFLFHLDLGLLPIGHLESHREQL